MDDGDGGGGRWRGERGAALDEKDLPLIEEWVTQAFSIIRLLFPFLSVIQQM